MTPLAQAVIPSLMQDEGFRATPYRCPAGRLTIGYGTNLDAGLDADEAIWLLEYRVARVVRQCLDAWPWFAALAPVRQGVLVQMAYQMGFAGVQGFRRMLAALATGDYDRAAAEMRASQWARTDSPGRARRLAREMQIGRPA